jgi:WD40 repeat protein
MGDFVGLAPTLWTDFPAHVARVALHPDGDQVAIALWNGTVLFRRLTNGAEITRLPPQAPPIDDLAFGPRGDILVTHTYQGSIQVWEQTATRTWALGRAIRATAGGGRGSLVITPNGKQVVTLGSRALSVWNLADGSLATTLAGPKGEPCQCLAMSPKGNWLAAGYRSEGAHGVLVWDFTSRKLEHTLSPRLDEVTRLAFSSDGNYLACACAFGAAVYDTEEFRRGLVVRGDGFPMVAFSPDNQFLALPGAVLGNLRLWGLGANRDEAVLTTKAWAHTVLFSPDGRRLLAADRQSIRVWNLASTPERRALAGHREGVPGVVFTPDGHLLVSVSKDQTAKIWDVATGRMLHQLTGFRGPLQAVAFSPDGRILATGDEAGGVRLWRVGTWQELAAVQHDLGKQIWAVAFSPDGGHFAACGERGLAIWRVQQGAADRPLACPLSATPIVRRSSRHDARALCFSPDSHLLAWGEGGIGGGEVLHLWDLAHSRECPAPPAPIGWLIHGLAFYPDSKQLSVVNADGASAVWDVSTGRRTFGLGLRKDAVNTIPQSVVALSSDGSWFAASRGRTVTVWDTQNRELLFTLPEERSMPWSLAWNPSRDLLAVGTSDGGLVLWSIPEVRRRLAELNLDW